MCASLTQCSAGAVGSYFFLKLMNTHHFRLAFAKRNRLFRHKEKRFYCTYTHRNTHCTVTLHVHVWQVADLSVSHTIHDTMDSIPLSHMVMRHASCAQQSARLGLASCAHPRVRAHMRPPVAALGSMWTR